jgi:hypothetical protein
MFGITFPAVYLPWVLIGFQFLMGGLPFVEILGVLGNALSVLAACASALSSHQHYISGPPF